MPPAPQARGGDAPLSRVGRGAGGEGFSVGVICLCLNILRLKQSFWKRRI